MQEERREILKRSVVTLSVKQLEDGERPGWLKRAVVVLKGDRVTIRFDVGWELGSLQARWEMIKIRVKLLMRKHG